MPGLPAPGLRSHLPALGGLAGSSHVGARRSLARGPDAAEYQVHRPGELGEYRQASGKNDHPAAPVGGGRDLCLAHKSIM